ncbi:hypothetical protein, partial [Klebsiella pneumoniae]|uniref:hypothetical protein n=1 Tax=Klebsiella pneumoniae TaxID=573 RepID=UPI001BB0DCF8
DVYKRQVVDDLSHVESFVTVGERGEVINLDADGNELHTPDSYREKLKIERGELSRLPWRKPRRKSTQ